MRLSRGLHLVHILQRLDRVTVALCIGAAILALTFFLPPRNQPRRTATPRVTTVEDGNLFDETLKRAFRFTIDD